MDIRNLVLHLMVTKEHLHTDTFAGTQINHVRVMNTTVADLMPQQCLDLQEYLVQELEQMATKVGMVPSKLHFTREH
jgi:hypothetical protein